LPLIGREYRRPCLSVARGESGGLLRPHQEPLLDLSVNGQGGRNVNVTVNGVDNKDNTVGGPVMQLPAEAVQEIQISTQRFSAVNGRSEGAAINVITKSGTNAYHGSAFGFFRNQALNAAQKLPNPGLNECPGGQGLFENLSCESAVFAPVVWRFCRRTNQEDKLFAFFANGAPARANPCDRRGAHGRSRSSTW